jgi:uncharacterized protein (TIGR04255 family)
MFVMNQSKIKKLPNAPLKEVIFELFWSLDYDQNGFPVDNNAFGLAKGKFSTLIEDDFKHLDYLLPDNIVLPQQVALRFWKDKNIYPVIQIGMGVIAVNDTEKNYVWEDTYKPLVLKAIENLEKSYRFKNLNYNKVRLKYIDSVDISDEEYANVRTFIKEKLNLNIENGFSVQGISKDINVSQSFLLEDGSNFVLSVNTGFNQQNQQNAIVWSLEVSKTGQIATQEISDWLEIAHEKTSSTFKNMLNPSFYDSFITGN